MAHPVNGLDDVVHQRARLGILALLRDSARADFGWLRDELELSDGNLSQHLRVLEQAGYVEVEKGYEGRRPRTWIHITKAGRAAFAAEIDTLKALVRLAQRAR